MAGSVTEALSAISGNGSVSPAATAGTHTPTPPATGSGGPMVLVPAGFIADLVGGLSDSIGEVAGGAFGHAKLGRDIGKAASPFIKLLPFQVIPPEVAPQSAGPDGQASGRDEAMIVVPSAFLGGVLGGLGGKLLGGQIDRFFGGNGSTGSAIGGTVVGAIGSLLPFQVVPPALTPASAGPDGVTSQEPMVVVPSSFFDSLLTGVAGTFGDLVAGGTGRKVAESVVPTIRRLLPFQVVPPELAPASAGPAGTIEPQDDLVVVPASFFSSIVGGLASTIGGEIGSIFGERDAGATIGGAAGTLLAGVLPFHQLPPALAPASAGPGATPEDTLMLVPAGLFANLLSGLAGGAGGAVGELLGDRATGEAVGKAASPLLKLLPFQVVAPGAAVS